MRYLDLDSLETLPPFERVRRRIRFATAPLSDKPRAKRPWRNRR